VRGLPAFKRRYGGIDFGYRNPFVAVWGGVDNDGILWLTHEHYLRQHPLSYHAAHLPRDVTWAADPSGAAERHELRLAGFNVHPGNNAIRAGIAAVQARIRNGTLKIIAGACPNLLAEAGLYRYDEAPAERAGEQPIGEYDHALDALRYLICHLDQRRLARPCAADSPLTPDSTPLQPPPNNFKIGCDFHDPAIWTRFR
jgi:hypothetical protein